MSDEKIVQMLNRENLTLASYLPRIVAFAIDELVISILFSIVVWEDISQLATQEQIFLFINSNILQIISLKILYHSFFIFMYGATLGKIFVKIRVISIDLLDNPSLINSFFRAVVRVFSESLLFLGYFWAFFDRKKQTWHDKMARTLVVNA